MGSQYGICIKKRGESTFPGNIYLTFIKQRGTPEFTLILNVILPVGSFTQPVILLVPAASHSEAALLSGCTLNRLTDWNTTDNLM